MHERERERERGRENERRGKITKAKKLTVKENKNPN
jgi:hypothetical protein